MNTLDFFSRLRKLGVKLSVEDQKLRLNAPQGVLTPSLKTELKDRKIELLKFLREQQQTGVAVPPPIRPTERSSDMPLSFAQQRLWFLTQMEPEQPVYNVPMAFRLSGLLCIEALSQGFADMIARHEIFRTTFSTIEGQPVQIIHESVDQPLSIRDFQHLPEDKREIEVENAVKQEITKPFDLENGPLFRTKLFRLGASEHILLILTHHIVFDGWSYEILCHELTTLYASKVAGQPQQLPKLPIQYADFAAWQREWLRGPSIETQVDYWREQLADAPTVLQLPTDRPYPAVQRLQGRSYSFALPLELSHALHTFSQQEGSTLFMTGLASFMLLLYRYTRQEDLIVGTSIANRSHVELEGLIGPLINTLALRTIISEGLSFRELLAQVRRTALAAYDHQDLPFEKLVEALQLERDISHTPLFQVMFMLQQETSNLLALTGLEVSKIELDTYTAKFDLTLNLIEGETGIRGQLEYNTDLFDDATIAQLMVHYETLFESIVADPDQRVSDVQILTDTERQQLLFDWNDTSSGYPRNRCVHELFEQQVEQSPDAVAVVYEDEQLTYRELNIRANQLARYLNKLGVGPEVLVGICLERSLEMVVGVLGILKAGGAYVPLDAAYPAERLAFMLSDAQIPVLLTQKRLVDTLPVYDGDVICLDNDVSAIAQESEENPTNGATPANLVYVIYTSGSTGRPKGVLIPHGALVNHTLAIARQYGLGSKDRVLQFASISFDLAAEEIFPSLLNGATVVLRPDQVTVSFTELLQFVEREKLTVLNPPTAYWHEWVSELSRSKAQLPPTVRLVIPGGEKASKEKFATWQKFVGNQVRWINGYGPTEATITATNYEPTSLREVQGSLSVPIGRPIANTRVYILNHHMQPVPVGVPGELYIGGDGLARGYLNRPELTVEKFISDPFSEDPAARIYKTGDLARYLADGNIEFLGRIDHQVKIRGFRIELGEIEATLCLQPSVSEAVAVAREDRPGDKRLVAYVVAAAAESAPSTGVLHAFLQKKLPDYMIPSAFVSIDAMPLTANGKVDRRALPAPDRMRPDLEEVFIAPRTQTEELIAGIWSNVLGLERIGVYDSFFELGGHSLLVVQIVSRIREVFEVELPLRALFEAPTVAGLTERIETACRSDERLQTYPLQAVSRDQDLPLSFAQERLWFLHHLEPDSVAYSMPRNIRLKGVLRKDALEKTYVELARRHETLRTTFHSTDGNPVLRIAAEPNIVLDTIDLRHLPGMEREAEAKRLSEEDARKPFDLRRGPLFRIRLFQLEDEEHVLHFNMHHIISDGWSFGVMDREISALYTAFIKDKPADLPELPVQYADYTISQRQWLQGEALEAQLNYWKDKLGGELPVLELPTDRPRPAVQTHRGAIESLALSKDLTDALQSMSRREGVTLFMTLLAVFKTLLYRLTGQEDTIVGTPIAGRNRTELEGLIGFFMNTIVLRTDLSGNPTFRELLGRVRETALGAYAHQDMPFEKLVEELSPERDLSRTPLFQVFFNHIVAMGDKATDLPGLETEAIGGFEEWESKFDMTLYVLEGEGGIGLRSLYNTDLFDSWRMAEILKQYEVLIKQIVENPDEKISHYSLVTAAVKDRLPDPIELLPSQWEGAIHTRFSEQAHVEPDQVAVVDRLDSWTYGELDRRSNQLANFLLENSVQPGDVVAIYAHRSASLVWSLLGILKAGAAFLIFDPAYPTQRLIDILQAAKPRAWFQIEDAGELAEELAENVEAQAANCHLVLPGLASAVELGLLEDYSDKDPEIVVGPDDLAYIAFTSGTTGEPKGIVGAHGPLSHFLNWHIENFSFNASDRFSMLSGLSHDPLLRDIFAPLWAGATLCIPEPGKMLFPAELISWMSARQITIAHMTPALSEVFVEGAQEAESIKEILSSIRYIFFGGDVLTWRHVEKIKRISPSAGFVNYYGATETPQAMGYYVVDTRKNGQFADGIPLGKGIEGVQLLVLNAAGRLAGVGEIAEVHVRTPYLSKGYLNDKNLTAVKFIGNPYTDTGDDRIYKTGDLGRYLPDGQVMFHGRSDRQVSLRGFRIELGEIEAALINLDAISNCALILREDPPNNQRLVAYYVLKSGSDVSNSEWRKRLQTKLPNYMIPQHFVGLESIPLTPTGKVDRKALPAPDRNRSQPAEALVSSRDELELQLTKIWEKVLGIKNVGIKDNFFDLGGHSLLVVQLFARIQKIFGKDLPLNTLFQAPTIEQLAGILRQKDWSSPWSSLVPIQHGGSKPPFFCVHGCTGKVLHFYDLARLLGPEQPFSGLSALGLEKGQVPHTQFEDMAAHYIKELRTIQFDGPYFIGGSGDGCPIVIEMAHQLESQGQNIGLIVLFSPTPLKPKISSTKLYFYRRSLRRFFFLLNNLLKKRPLIPAIVNAFLNRVLWQWKILHRYLPRHIHRWRRFIAAFRKARFSYTPRAYQGRITCFLSDEFSLNYKKSLQDWYELASGGIDIRFVPGTINTMWQEPHVRILAEQLKACLEEAQKDNEEFIDTKN